MTDTTFDDFYNDNHGRVTRTCRRKLSADEAEDAAQEVWLKVFRGWPGAPRTPTVEWLNTIMANVIIDIYRRRRVTASLTEWDSIGADVASIVETNLALAEACAVLNTLTPSRRSFFVRYITREPGTESSNAERVRVVRIREKVRAACRA